MAKTLLMMYVTLFSPILSGVFNMIWCKVPVLNCLKYPMDFNKKFIDGKRIFGDNKTWKGFVGYLVLNILITVIWGFVCNGCGINHLNYFYVNNNNTIIFNIFTGLLLGLGYSLFELPNSFIKRRLGIEEGKSTNGLKKIFFIFLDLGILLYLLYVLVGAITHIVFNMILYFLHLRKNMF